MLVFLFGKETFLARRKLQEIIAEYATRHANPVHLRRLDCSTVDPSQLQTELQTNSLFQDKKLLIVQNALGNPAIAEFLAQRKKILETSKDIIVFFEEGDPKKSQPLFRLLQTRAKTQEFAPLEGPRLRKWITQEFWRYGVQIETEAVAVLQKEIGSDAWQLSNEIKKLAAFAKSKNSFLRTKDLKPFFQQINLETDVFAAINALRAGNKKRALELLCVRLEKGDRPLSMLPMLSWYIRTLANPRVMHEKIFQTDLAIKTGKQEPAVALFSLVAGL
ncbi:MAG: DNA polymerase III subunit delta [Candidatus Wildermuthbacteria bacterium]|nr:DNA polymerase III subunit delta [Candidatus Wildermuthbacteria bacterium]